MLTSCQFLNRTVGFRKGEAQGTGLEGSREWQRRRWRQSTAREPELPARLRMGDGAVRCARATSQDTLRIARRVRNEGVARTQRRQEHVSGEFRADYVLMFSMR